MVYCNIKERHNGYAVYMIGSDIDDITGEITFYPNGQMPVLNKQPERHPVNNLYIARLYLHHKEDIEKGVFKDKMAFEIG